MAVPRRHRNNITLGAGHARFAPERDDDVIAALPFGDSPGFSLSVNTERLEDFDSDGPVAEQHLDVVTRVTRAFSITLKNISMRNLAWFAMGDLVDVEQDSDEVTSEPHLAVPGGYLQLGVTGSNPLGARLISDVEVTDGDMVTYVAGTDYDVDEERGQLLIVPDGAIAEAARQAPEGYAEIEVDYDAADAEWQRIATHGRGPIRGALHYVSDNTRGDNRVLYAPQVTLVPEGEMQMKSRTEVAQATFSVRVEVPDGGGSALYIDDQPVEVES